MTISELAPPATSADATAQHLAAFTRDGYTVMPQRIPPQLLAAWIAAFPGLSDRARFLGAEPLDLYDMLDLAPELFLPCAADPVLLGFAEAVMGPRVQIDSIHFRLDASACSRRLQPVHWHRDKFAVHPPEEGVYLSPLAFNAVTYPQGLDPDRGPLRLIPGSHRQRVEIPAEERGRPHAGEILLCPEPGDVVLLHHALWHSGSVNVSAGPRWFVSIYYMMNWLMSEHRAAISAPMARLRAQARDRGDRRLLRLLGEDDRRFARQAEGGMEPEERVWARWQEADRLR